MKWPTRCPSKRTRPRKPSLRHGCSGESGVQLVNALDDGSVAIRRHGDEARRLGLITEKQARSAEEYIDEQARLKQVVSGLAAAIGGQLIPKLTPLITKFREWLLLMKPAIVRGFPKGHEGHGGNREICRKTL